MADLYVDHNVAREITARLRASGHNVIAIRELSLERADDDAHLLRAAQQDRIFLTHDIRDFELLHDAWRRWTAAWQIQQEHSGIIVLPQRQWSFAQTAYEVNRFLTSGQKFPNELYRWRVERGWVRRPLPR